MNLHLNETVNRIFNVNLESLPEPERKVMKHIADKTNISRNINDEFSENLTLGQKIADKVASFGGSWTFILIFITVLVAWVVLNSVILIRGGKPFDPFPYILLNLFLSMIAAIQAPVIMMSQNRHAQKDRLDANHDYEVNLKSELEILSLHEKVDELRARQWDELVRMQQEQIKLLQRLLEEKGKG
jgi:uncharacterized membrane protein